MKFPLPERPFPPLILSHDDRRSLIAMTDGFLRDTLRDYETLLYQDRGVVDVNIWKCIKKRQDVLVYQVRDQQTKDGRKWAQSMNNNNNQEEELDHEQPNFSDKMQALLWLGTIQGTLNDFMYGVVNPTTESMKIKSSYVPDNIADCMVLANIIEATPSDPFRGLQLKWCVNGGPFLMRQVIRYRDFVYLEATGITRSSMGERIGYHIVETVEIPGIRHLHEFKFVRATMSLYHLFRQKEDGVIEIYVRARMDFHGDLPQKMAILALCEGVVSLSQAHVFSEMKKLNWMVKIKRMMINSNNNSSTANINTRVCCVCQKHVIGQADHRNSCYVCLARVCKHCRVARKLSFLATTSRNVVQQTMTFCSNCVATALYTDGMIVAMDELAQHNHMYDFDVESITDSSSRLSTASISSMRWLRSFSRSTSSEE